MSFVMMYADEAGAQREGHCLARFKSHHQCAWETGPLSRRNGIDLTNVDVRFGQGRARDRQKVSQMLTGGQLGDHPAVLGMHLNL